MLFQHIFHHVHSRPVDTDGPNKQFHPQFLEGKDVPDRCAVSGTFSLSLEPKERMKLKRSLTMNSGPDRGIDHKAPATPGSFTSIRDQKGLPATFDPSERFSAFASDLQKTHH